MIGLIRYCCRKWMLLRMNNIILISWGHKHRIWRLWILIRWRLWISRLRLRMRYFFILCREFVISWWKLDHFIQLLIYLSILITWTISLVIYLSMLEEQILWEIYTVPQNQDQRVVILPIYHHRKEEVNKILPLLQVNWILNYIDLKQRQCLLALIK